VKENMKHDKGAKSSFLIIIDIDSMVSRGPYHYVRHPIYAAMLVLVIGTAWTKCALNRDEFIFGL
jgi:isoprenylcysteine carboxyl methyltransferase (ICMT) family protein YpbQ